MDLPITRPSMICYADEIEFPEFLKNLSDKKHNGFIRITSGSDEGFILFKKGEEIAASYDRYSRVDAIEKIKDAMDNNKTLIEIFDVRLNQIDFFMNMNKPFIIGSEAYDLIDELKRSNDVNNIKPELTPEPKAVPIPKPVSETIKVSEIVSKPVKNETEPKNPINTEIVEDKPISEHSLPLAKNSNESESSDEIEPVKSKPDPNPVTIKEEVPEINDSEITNESSNNKVPIDEPMGESIPELVKSESVKSEPEMIEPSAAVSSTDTSVVENLNSIPESNQSETESQEELEEAEMPPMDRSELMKKYGIKEIQEEDVDNILESYKGGSVSDENVEKIELTLMNKIKKSILALNKIKGAEVMVFLDNANGLSGKVNIIIELESKGFLSRLMGNSKDNNLERQIIDISQIEIRKSFRKYPEIVDEFEVNVEIS
jgi:Uncharacterized protein conserved in archaea (DUF2226)